MCLFVVLCHSPNAIVAQSKNCPFGVNTTFELKIITTTSDNYGMYWGMFQVTSVLVLLDVTKFSRTDSHINM